VDENTGYAVGEKGLMTTTTNAGNTWQLVKTGTTMCLTGMNYHQGILYIYSEKGTYFTMSLR
jgi:photosystem II stability/assembly factor-like uncharacterized protein